MFIIAIFLFGCKTQKGMIRKDMLSRGTLNTTLDTAVIIIPVEAEIADLQHFIETTFDNFQFGDQDEDLQVKASVRPGVILDVIDDSISVQIPMNLDILQSTLFGKIRATGTILLDMKSQYDIDSAWTFTTSSRVVDYRWIEKPKANMSVISFSIESLSNRLIEQNKEQLVQSIDEQICQNIDLKKSISDIWYRLKSPMLVSEEYKIWMQMKPLGIGLSRLSKKTGKLQAYIKAASSPKINVGDRPADVTLDTIPTFKWLSPDTSGFLVPIRLTIPDQEIADFANDFLSDEVFDLGKKKIRVRNVEVKRSGSRWLVSMDLYGDVSGRVRMKGTPVFNSRKEEVALDKFDYEVDSRNILLKSSALLFKQKVEKQLVDQLKNEVEKGTKDSINKAMDELNVYTTPLAHRAMDQNIASAIKGKKIT